MNNKQTVAVIVGRFQVHALHEGHMYLIETALKECSRIILVVGCTGAQPTNVDPHPFSVRKRMLLSTFSKHMSHVEVVRLQDRGDDAGWSRALDALVTNLVDEEEDILFYGSRDSFATSYTGSYAYKEIEAVHVESGTQMRKEYSWDKVPHLESAMMGASLSTQERYPIAYQTVDVAVFSADRKKMLLGRKPDKDTFCFIGGFVDPGESLEEAVLRELSEETAGSITVTKDKPAYIGSAAIDDSRYSRSEDGVTTTFFATTYVSGEAVAGDDLEEVRWFNLDEVADAVGKAHQPLADLLQEYVQ